MLEGKISFGRLRLRYEDKIKAILREKEMSG